MNLQSTSHSDQGYADLHFLIIDDNQMMRHWLRSQVINTGAKIIDQAPSFGSALRMLKSDQRYDVILCDYNLDESRDGQQLFEEARRNNLLSPTSVWIMVTGERDYQQIFSAVELLPDDYLLKPFTSATLQKRVNRALHRARALAEPNQYFFSGEYDRCIDICQQTLLNPHPYTNDLRRIYGEAMLQTGKYTEAHQYYINQLQSGLELPWARLGLARACFHMEKNDEAHDLLELIILESPDYLQAHDWMAQIQERLGNPQVAKEILTETLHKNPKALWRHREIVRVALQSDDHATAARAYEALHNHGRGSSFLSPGDFSGYALLLTAIHDQKNSNKLRQLGDLLRNFFSTERRFDFARLVTEHALAITSNSSRTEAQIYSQMKAAITQAIESNDRLALLNAAIRDKDDEVIHTTARALFLDHDGNKQMQKRIHEQFPSDLHNLAKQVEIEAKREAKSLEERAIALAIAGDLTGAIDEFDRLSKTRPTLSILYNAGVALAKWVEKYGWTAERGAQLDRYINGIQTIDPSSLKLKRLQDFRAHLPSSNNKTKYVLNQQS